jgi:AcrR family transcriptional regulator
MKNQKPKRNYQMKKRAASSVQTARDIYTATVELWHERSIKDITLDAIAARAGVSIRTIIRRFGSKKGLFEACIQNTEPESEREKATVGNIEEAIHYLLMDYETHGDALIKTLAIEDELEVAHMTLTSGRKYHRAWCARIFAPFLSSNDDIAYEQTLRCFVAATEFYLWKLMRRDLKHSFEETKETFLKLVKAVATQGTTKI